MALVSACIKSVTYSILFNGQPHGLITPSRRLRQGDPLSPYLFLMVTKGLHALLKKAEESGNIKGVLLCATGPRVFHLLFANDGLAFCRATIAECVQIQSLLFMYEQASGQSINRGKTSIFFSSNTLHNLWNAISIFLGVPVSHCYEHYLGLPSLVGR